MTYQNYQQKEDGFTLVEILVVILIIGILASIAVPVFLNQKKKAGNATLESDMKNATTAVQTWMSNGGSIDGWRALTGGMTSALVEGENPDNLFPATYARWNKLEGVPPITVSNATSMEIPMVTGADLWWQRIHEDGEFCIKASNHTSDYNGRLYGDTFDTLNKSLYYDVRGGGLHTMEELVAMDKGDNALSCNGYINRYKSTL